MIIRLTNTQTLTKPSGREISYQQINNQDVDITLEQLADYIRKGHAFWASTYNIQNKQTNQTYISSELLVIDIDNGGKVLGNVLKVLKEHNLIPNIYYITFSSTHNNEQYANNFRLVYKIHKTESIKVLYMLSYLLCKVIKIKMDETCAVNHRTQPFQATNKNVYYTCEDVNLTIDKLIAALILTSKKPQRVLQEIVANTDMCAFLKDSTIKKLDFEIADKPGNDYQMLSENTFINYNFKQKSHKNYTAAEHGVDKNTKMDMLISRCPYAKGLDDGSIDRPTNAFRWRIASQLSRVSGGLTWFKEILINSGKSSSEVESFLKYYENTQSSSIAGCVYCKHNEEGCAYFNDCKYKNIYYISKDKDAYVPTVDKDYTADMLSRDITRKLKEVIEEDDKDIIDLFPCQVGGGKSHAYKYIVNNDDIGLENALMSIPNHLLANEVYQDLQNAYYTKQRIEDGTLSDRKYVYAYNRPEIIVKEIEDQLRICESEKLYKESRDIVTKYIDKDFTADLKIDDIKLRNKFYEMVDTYEDTNLLRDFLALNCSDHPEASKIFDYLDTETFKLERNVRQLRNWRLTIEESKTADFTICTHAGLILRNMSQYKHDLIIIDEDDLSSALQQQKFSIRKIKNVLSMLEIDEKNLESLKYFQKSKDKVKSEKIEKRYYNKLRKSFVTIIDKLSDIIDNSSDICYKKHELTPAEISICKYVRKIYNLNLYNFLSANTFSKNGEYINTSRLLISEPAENQKIIYLTATPEPIEILQARYPGKKIRVHSFKQVENAGTFKCEDKFGKVYYKNLDDEKIKEICEYLKENNIEEAIVPKKFCEKFNEHGIATTLWHGNAIGSNVLSGKRIAVVSQQIPSSSDLYALLSLIEQRDILNAEIKKPRSKKIDILGKKQFCLSYDNDIIDNFIKFIVEADLIQAIGRARLIRQKDAEVIYIGAFDVRV